MLNRNGLDTLPALRSHMTGGDDVWQPMPTRASRSYPFSFASRQGERVGAVRVAAAGGGEDLLLGRHDGRLGLPRVVVLDAADQRGVDVVVLAQPDQHRRHEPAVLAHLVHHVVARPGEVQLAPDAGHLVGLADPAEQVHVGRRLPRPEARAGPGAGGAALLAVDAVVEAELLLEVERHVLALLVLVADHVVGAGDDAAGAAGAQAGRDDLGVQLLPLRRPAPGLSGWDEWGISFDSGHARTVRDRARARSCAAAFDATVRRR